MYEGVPKYIFVYVNYCDICTMCTCYKRFSNAVSYSAGARAYVCVCVNVIFFLYLYTFLHLRKMLLCMASMFITQNDCYHLLNSYFRK